MPKLRRVVRLVRDSQSHAIGRCGNVGCVRCSPVASLAEDLRRLRTDGGRLLRLTRVVP